MVPYRPLAPRVPRAARPPLRYVDLARLERAWRRVASVLERVRPDVVYANPCRFLQAPAALLTTTLPSLYFCDEPRGGPAELAQTRNPRTSTLYGRLHAAESRLDRAATSHATALATNSEFTAGAIRRAYGRDAAVLPMGIPPAFTPSWEPAEHLLSVGTLIPDKGHDIVLRAASLARTRRPVMIVAPRQTMSEQRRLLSLAAELGIELKVRVAISDAELVTAYRRAHATLYLAREEPFGLASLEAQACASPVIVSAAGGLPETLRRRRDRLGSSARCFRRGCAARSPGRSGSAASHGALRSGPCLRGELGEGDGRARAAARGLLCATQLHVSRSRVIDVLMLTNTVAPDKLGGLERIVRELAAELVQRGSRVTVLAKQVNAEDPRDEVGDDGVVVQRYRLANRSSRLFAPTYPLHTARAVRSSVRRAGAAVLHAHFPVPAVPLALARKPYVYSFHAPVYRELLLERHTRYPARPTPPACRGRRSSPRRAARRPPRGEDHRSE